MKILNAQAAGTVFYGLHMVEGVAEYKDQKDSSGNALRIFVGEHTIKNMDPSFAGRPVFVHHVDDVSPDVSKVKNDADGWVMESFFNKADGKHWVKFLVLTEAGKERIKQGWKLSNAYHMKNTTGGGRWHGVDYAREVLQGEYEHLAIVPNPRYEESIILTPEEFKAYNAQKETELFKLANANDTKEKRPMFEFFKKQKVDNSADLEGVSVRLPKSKREVSIEKLVNEADEAELNSKQPYMCNGEERVKVGEDEMSVNELVEKHLAMKSSASPDPAKPENEDAADKDAKAAEAKKNAEEEEKKKNEEAKKSEEEKAKNALHFAKLKNAEDAAAALKNQVVDLSEDKVARGKVRYGSK